MTLGEDKNKNNKFFMLHKEMVEWQTDRHYQSNMTQEKKDNK